MKKIITILTAILLIFSFSAGTYAAEINFTDVNATDWFYKNLQELVEKNIASGYPDGTFKSENTLKFEEFVKMVVMSDGQTIEQKEGQEWHQIYIDKAIEGKYITEQQKSLVGQNISRGTMAEILYNVLTEKETIKSYTDAELQYLSDRLTDINKADVKTLTINGIGVIRGYPDKTFKPNNTLTRAEAVAVISRIVDPELRNPIKIVLRDANGIIDANDLEKVPIEQTNYQKLKDYIDKDFDGTVKYKVENLIKADASMFPIRLGSLVITGVEKLPAENAPYYGDTSIAWGSSNDNDSIIIHAYSTAKTDDYENTIGYSPLGIKIATVYKSGYVFPYSVTAITTEYGGENAYNKIKEKFPDFALGSNPRVEINQQFTSMSICGESSKGYGLENIDKLIIMDTRWTSSSSSKDVLEIDAKDVKEIK